MGLKKSSSGAVFCGGTLITPTRVLTAAHCVDRLVYNKWCTCTNYMIHWIGKIYAHEFFYCFLFFLIVRSFDRLSVSEISTLTASFGMNFQMTSSLASDAVLTRRVVRVIYHLEYNRKSKVHAYIYLKFIFIHT